MFREEQDIEESLSVVSMGDIESLVFSGGEVHIKDVPKIDRLFARIKTSDDLMKLLLVTDAHKRKFGTLFDLYMPYIPYARQDRVANIGEALSIRVFADLINSQNYPHVYVLDPHSEVSMAVLNNAVEYRKVSDSYLKLLIPDYKDKVVVAPDAGAYKKLSKVIKEVPLIYCTKQRDTKTGKLSNLEVHAGDVDLKDKTLLVVDDICDGGGTFLMLLNELRKQGYENPMELYVTHGIFSRGTYALLYPSSKDGYKHIYTTDSFYKWTSEDNISVFSVLTGKLIRAEKEGT